MVVVVYIYIYIYSPSMACMLHASGWCKGCMGLCLHTGRLAGSGHGVIITVSTYNTSGYIRNVSSLAAYVEAEICEEFLMR